jgi:hypothetical protein
VTGSSFTCVHTEGGLLPPDLLERVRNLDPELSGLRPEDYGLAPGERLADAIVQSWNRLTGVWQAFADRLEAAPATETTFQTQTVQRWLRPLFAELGFGPLTVADAVTIDDKTYPVSHRTAGVAVHLVGARVDLDRRPRPGVRPAHSMVQEYLNRTAADLWAVTSNGLRLRVLRDSSSLTRQAYVEFDLEAMFRGQQYADFALCWLVCHATRFAGDPPSSCYLERWSNQARTDGTRALDQLRGGVEAAIEALGTGFLSDPTNRDLRERLQSGELPVAEYHRQLLRLVYRLIFLLVAEARGLLHPPDADAAAVDRYRRWYSLGRVVELSRSVRGTAHGDLWAQLGVVFDALAGPGQPALGLSGLGSFLWSPAATADLSTSSLPNRALLDAVHRLTTVADPGERRRVRRNVDYRNMGAEELGSVYEALLELHPGVDVPGRRFALTAAAGNERRTTGSYYTPTPLIRVLLDSALDPVLDEAEAAPDPERALLEVKVLDPAAGSGHFLVAAAHRIAHRLASVRSGEAEPSPEELRHALRDVIAHCVHGIDVNPMAVELCKVSLWMEATEPGRPLSFLDHHIVCGNSLLGTTPALMAAGLPDEAFKALEGDDRQFVTTLKKRNKAERKQREQYALDLFSGGDDVSAVAKALAELDAMPEDTAEAVAAKEAARARFAADAWCASFVVPKVPGAAVLTDEVVRQCAKGPDAVPADVREAVEAAAEQFRFLHLHLAFPDVFPLGDGEAKSAHGWSGGFTVVLGNPPWERVKLSEREFFASRDPDIASAPNTAVRRKMIAALATENPELLEEFQAAVRQAAGESQILRCSGRYPLSGRGDVNTYAVFAELMRDSIDLTGRVGIVVPTGIATDDTTKHFFGDLVDHRSLVSLYDFENRNGVFPGVHRSYKFALLAMSGPERPADEAAFVFFALDVTDLDEPDKRFTLAPEDFELINPNTRTCPVFRTRRDADIAKGVYRRLPVLVNERDSNGNPWAVGFSTMFHMSGDSHLFRTREQLESDSWRLAGNHYVKGNQRWLPLYEAKMIHHFDHRWATFDGSGAARAVSATEKMDPAFVPMPRYWVPAPLVESRGSTGWRIGFRNVTNVTNERTTIFGPIPLAGIGHSLPFLQRGKHQPDLMAVMNSLAADWVARQKLGGTNMTFGYVNQFLAPHPGRSLYRYVLELVFTAWDLADFAESVGHSGPPFRWVEERRALLRAELDAMMFRLYGVERDDVDYIMETFPILKRKDEAEFREYRTKRLILERYDAMAAAEAAGEEYVPALDPPPAHPSLCHPESTRPDWAK